MVKHGDVDLAAFADAHDLFGRFEDASGRDKVPLMGVFGDPGVVWRACGLTFAASAPAWRLAVSFLIHVFLRSLWAVRGRGAQQKEIPHEKRAEHTPPGPHCRIRAEEAVFKLSRYSDIASTSRGNTLHLRPLGGDAPSSGKDGCPRETPPGMRSAPVRRLRRETS